MGRYKVKFGVQTSLNGVRWQELLDFWRFMDRETAFHSAWTFDHFVPPNPGADPNGPCFEGWSSLAALAQATERLRVGCLVTGNTYRHPAVLAKMAATVDHVSGGRLDFGIGAGWHEPEHRAYGIAFPSVRERQDRLEEAVRLIRLVFDAEAPVDFQGKYYSLQQAPFVPRCLQVPHPPIMVGGGGEKRTLRTAARYADVMNVPAGPAASVRHKIEVLEQHCRDAGRDPNEIERTVFGVVIVSDNQTLVDRVAAATAPGFGLTPEQAKEQLPIGTAAHVREVVEGYAELGVTQVIMATVGPWKPDLYARISRDLVEAFR